MINKRRLLCTLWLSIFFSVPSAFAGNGRSWVASTGSDSNPCTRSQPCATFQGALANTNAGGEIDVVNPGDYGAILIVNTGGFTIDGGGMAHISAGGGAAAIQVLGASGPVIVRNLTVTGGGISFANSSAAFHAENVTVSDTPFGNDGFSIYGGTATLEHVVVYDVTGPNNFGIVALNGAVVQVRNSVINNITGGGILAVFSATVTVDTTSITSCGTAIQSGDTFNGTSGTVLLSNSTVTKNATGLLTQSGGSIVSFVNNRIYGNTANGSPTQSVFQK
jgi:Right handed beta helix region